MNQYLQKSLISDSFPPCDPSGLVFRGLLLKKRRPAGLAHHSASSLSFLNLDISRLYLRAYSPTESGVHPLNIHLSPVTEPTASWSTAPNRVHAPVPREHRLTLRHDSLWLMAARTILLVGFLLVSIASISAAPIKLVYETDANPSIVGPNVMSQIVSSGPPVLPWRFVLTVTGDTSTLGPNPVGGVMIEGVTATATLAGVSLTILPSGPLPLQFWAQSTTGVPGVGSVGLIDPNPAGGGLSLYSVDLDGWDLTTSLGPIGPSIINSWAVPLNTNDGALLLTLSQGSESFPTTFQAATDAVPEPAVSATVAIGLGLAALGRRLKRGSRAGARTQRV